HDDRHADGEEHRRGLPHFRRLGREPGRRVSRIRGRRPTIGQRAQGRPPARRQRMSTRIRWFSHRWFWWTTAALLPLCVAGIALLKWRESFAPYEGSRLLLSLPLQQAVN